MAAWRRFDRLVAERDGPSGSTSPARPGDETSPPPEIEPSDGLTLLQAGRRTDGQGLQRAVSDDLEGALVEWCRAAELYAEAGEEERRQAALSRTGSLLCQSGREAEGLPLLEAAQSYLHANAVQRRRALAALLRLASAYAATERAPQALALLDQALAEGVDRPEAGDLADVDLQRARVLLQLGGREAEEEAAQALQRACAGYRLTTQRGPLAEAALLLAQLLPGISDPSDDAARKLIGALCTEAVVNAPAHVPGLNAAAHAHRGGWLLSEGEDAQAAEDLIEAVAGFTALGAYPQAAYARQDLCVAYYNAGRHLEAAEVAEEAIPMFGELNDLQAARRCRYLLANAQRELGERGEAAETFTGLAREEVADNPVAAAEFLEAAGDLLSGLDKDALAAERFADAAQAHAAVGDPRGVVRSRRRQGLCLCWAGQAEAGLGVMALAREALAELARGDEATLTWETALLCYDEARIYGALGRNEAAIAGMDQAIEGFEALDENAAAQTARDQRAVYTEGP
jgi:tetratricopeptide (TPR) repeat protein